MHLLLPPSEAKTTGGRGRPLRSRPAHPQLGPARAQVLDALGELVADDPARAARDLILPPGVADAALAANSNVSEAPTTPALRRYAGVVYDGLAYAALDDTCRRIADRRILVFSGLFGVVRGDEPVPDYRVPAKAVLPGLGTVGTFWRHHLTDILPVIIPKGMVVDLRSSDYAAMWRPPRERTVVVRVLSPLPRGGLGVISYDSKLAKGRLAAELIRRLGAGVPVRTTDDIAAAWITCGGTDVRPAAGTDGVLEVITEGGARRR